MPDIKVELLRWAASFAILVLAGDAFAQNSWGRTMPSSGHSAPRQPQSTSGNVGGSHHSAESILDYYDGLRAWDLGEPVIATGIWLQASAHGDRRAMRRLAQLYEEGN